MFDYDLPESWYEENIEPEYHCQKCDEKEKALRLARDYLVQIMDILYGEAPLKAATLDDVFGELCYQFDVQVPAHLPKVTRKDPLSHWIEFNNQYLNNLHKERHS